MVLLWMKRICSTGKLYPYINWMKIIIVDEMSLFYMEIVPVQKMNIVTMDEVGLLYEEIVSTVNG